MIKRYCDRCGTHIENRDFRKLSMTTADDEYILACEECVEDTVKDVELCRKCAGEILRFIKDKKVYALTDEDGFPIT